MYDSLLQAYDQARRRAQMNGMAVSKEDTMKALGPIYSQYARDAMAGRQLDQNRELFDKRLAFEQETRDKARPIQIANALISGAGAIGTGLYANRQDDLYRQKLAALMKLYGGK